MRRPSNRWAAPLGAGVALLGLTLLAFALSLWIGRSPSWAYDFHAYYDAALRVIATGTPYQAETLAGPFRPGPFGLYLYSPPLALLIAPLTALGEEGAILVWLGLRLVLLALTCALMPVSTPIRLATLGVASLSAPFLHDLDLGNVSLIVTFLAVLVWRWLDRPIGSIALAVSLTLRPTMVLVCGWWLLRGRWRPVAWAAIAFLMIVIGTLPFVGIDGWLQYVTVLRNVTDVTGVSRNLDLGSSALLLGGPTWAASLALFAGYATAVVAVLLSLRRDRELSYIVTIMATLLLAPLLWDHYLTNLLLPAAFLASRGRPWALALPLLCWIPLLLALAFPQLSDSADALLPYVAVVGLLLPFMARDRAGEPPDPSVDRLRNRDVKL